MTVNIPFLVGYIFAATTYGIGTAYQFGLIRDTFEWRFAVRALLFGCWYTFFLGCLALGGAW